MLTVVLKTTTEQTDRIVLPASFQDKYGVLLPDSFKK